MKRARRKWSWYDTPNYQYRQLESNGILSRALDRPIYVFPEMKLRGLIPKSYIHVSVRDLYIPRTDLPNWT
jgi:hypothetical protein